MNNLVQNIIHDSLIQLQGITAIAATINDETYSNNCDIELIRSSSENIINEAIKINMIFDNYKKISTTQNNTFIYENVDILSLIYKTINVFDNEAKNKCIYLTKPIIENKKIIIKAIKSDIFLALTNLYSNALKHSYSKKMIKTKCKVTNDYFEIKVTNYGTGILSEEIETGAIFMLGYKGRLSSKRKGSGIGLHIIQDIIVREHLGKVAIESIKMNDGFLTTVKILIPYKRSNNEKNIMD